MNFHHSLCSRKLFLVLLSVCTLFTFTYIETAARLLTKEEASDTMELNIELNVAKDGNSTYTETASGLTIEKEAGKESRVNDGKDEFSNKRSGLKGLWIDRFLMYRAPQLSPDNIYILKKNKQKDPISNYYTKDLNSKGGVNTLEEVLGDAVFLDYTPQQISKKFPEGFPVQFYWKYDFSGDNHRGIAFLTQKFSLRIRSELPLFLDVNDPKGYLKVTYGEGSPETGFYSIDIVSTAPIFEMINLYDSNAEKMGTPDAKQFTSICLRSYKEDKEQLGQYGKFYEEVMAETLPNPMQSFMETLRSKDKKKDIYPILQEILKFLVKTSYYNRLRDDLLPKKFRAIEKTEDIDNEDILPLTVKLLRELGYKAYVGFSVDHDSFFRQFLPFIMVTLPSGESLWLHPRRSSHMEFSIVDQKERVEIPGAILTTIPNEYEGKPVFVMVDGQLLEKNLPISKDSRSNRTYTLQFSSPHSKETSSSQVSLEVEEDYYGNTAEKYDDYAFDTDKKTKEIRDYRILEDALYLFHNDSRRWGDYNKGFNKNVDVKITRDTEPPTAMNPFHIRFRLPDVSSAFLENGTLERVDALTLKMKLPTEPLVSILMNTYERGCVSDLSLVKILRSFEAYPYTVTYILKNVTAKTPQDVIADSPWCTVTRKTTNLPNGDLEIHLTSRVKKQLISSKERNSEEYKAFITSLEKNFKDQTITLTLKKSDGSKDVVKEEPNTP